MQSEMTLNSLFFIFIFMKKVVITSLALASVVFLSGCELLKKPVNTVDIIAKESDAMMKKDDTMVKDESIMKKEDVIEGDAMMKKDESITKDSSMIKEETVAMVKSYDTYSPESVDTALASGKKVALFFHATWCPSCVALNKTITSEEIPSEVVIFKVDYDTNTELRKKYGVTGQHTIVTIDSNKNMLKRERGAQNIADIIALF